jgi:hypothetical protein
MENWGAKTIRQQFVATLGADAYRRSQVHICFQKFRNGDLSCENAPGTGRPPLTMGLRFVALRQNYPFPSARLLAQHFLTSMPTIKEILHIEWGLKNSRGAGCLIFCPLSKRLLVLKHQQRCDEFYQSRKRVILKESQQVTSPDSNIPIPPQKCWHDRQHMSF